jgi:hypothetical protein
MTILNIMLFYIIPLLIGFGLNAISSVFVRNRAEALLINPYSPLPDLIHHNFPKINTLTPDYFLFLCSSVAIFNYSSLENIKPNILCVGICFIIRSFSVFLTIMPTCMHKPKSKPNNLYTKYFVSTHDLMFSGHSLFFIAIGNMLNSFVIQMVGPFLLIISRQHYTIDVCVSGLIYFYIYSKIEYIIVF